MEISEFELISRIKKSLVTAPVDLIKGIGDDCAIIKKDEDHVFVVSTDCLIEKIHFDLKSFSFIELGKKSMSVNLSDIAAMGAEPRYAFVTIGVPDHILEADILDLYTGLQQVADEFSTAIIGGDTSSSPRSFFISLTVVGIAKTDRYKLRSTAKAGESIYVTGPLGSSALGLRLIQKKKMRENHYIQAHKNPRPKLLIGQILGDSPAVGSMIDISDGLLQDLSHITKSSRVAAVIDYDSIPRDEGFEAVCKSVGANAIEMVLTGGEDYHLCFTVDESKAADLHQTLQDKRIKIHKIGTILPHEQIDQERVMPNVGRIRVLKDGQQIILKKSGYDHFLAAFIKG